MSKKKTVKQTPIEAERQRRICVAVWAYAYEYLSTSIVSDAKFDKTCKEINVDLKTGHKIMDKWFKEKYHPDTGSWIGEHPYLNVIHERTVLLCKHLKIPFTYNGKDYYK